MHTKFKTVCTIFLIMSIIFVVFVPPAHAIPVTVTFTLQLPFDIPNLIETTLTTIADTADWILSIYADIKDNMLDPAAWIASKIQIHEEANTILNQVRGGGNDRKETPGGPLFVTNWETVSRKAVENQRVFFLQELAVSKKVDPAFQGTLLSAFSANPNRSVFDRNRSSFGNDIGCDDANNGGQSCLEGFLGDFSQGGWTGWNSVITQPGNNPYLSYIVLKGEKAGREEEARQARINEALASQGALGTQDCVDEPTAEGDLMGPPAPGEDGPPKLQKCKVTRPGSTVTSDLSKVLQRSSDSLTQVDEAQELFIGGITSLISTMRTQGIKSDNEDPTRDFVLDSQDALKETNRAQTAKKLSELKASVNKAINELATIWELKVKSFDLIDDIPPGLIYEIKQTQLNVDTNGSCANKPDIYEQLPGNLADAESKRDQLAKEVGYPVDFANPINGVPDLGYYENGGQYSEDLLKEQSNLEYLEQVINNPDIEPSIVAYDPDVASIFEKDGNGKYKYFSDDRIHMAQQLIESEVGKVLRLLTQIGTAAGAKAEQQGINQNMLNQRGVIRSCSIND